MSTRKHGINVQYLYDKADNNNKNLTSSLSVKPTLIASSNSPGTNFGQALLVLM